MAGGPRASLELALARPENPFELLVVRDHDHALRPSDGALPWSRDVLAVELREVFETRHASSPSRSGVELFEPEFDDVARSAQVDEANALRFDRETASRARGAIKRGDPPAGEQILASETGSTGYPEGERNGRWRCAHALPELERAPAQMSALGP